MRVYVQIRKDLSFLIVVAMVLSSAEESKMPVALGDIALVLEGLWTLTPQQGSEYEDHWRSYFSHASGADPIG